MRACGPPQETDPSIHRPHKQLLLLPGPPGQYVSVDSPGLNSPPGSVVGGSSMGGGLANPPIYPSAPYPVTHGTGAGTGAGGAVGAACMLLPFWGVSWVGALGVVQVCAGGACPGKGCELPGCRAGVRGWCLPWQGL